MRRFSPAYDCKAVSEKQTKWKEGVRNGSAPSSAKKIEKRTNVVTTAIECFAPTLSPIHARGEPNILNFDISSLLQPDEKNSWYEHGGGLTPTDLDGTSESLLAHLRDFLSDHAKNHPNSGNPSPSGVLVTSGTDHFGSAIKQKSVKDTVHQVGHTTVTATPVAVNARRVKSLLFGSGNQTQQQFSRNLMSIDYKQFFNKKSPPREASGVSLNVLLPSRITAAVATASAAAAAASGTVTNLCARKPYHNRSASSKEQQKTFHQLQQQQQQQQLHLPLQQHSQQFSGSFKHQSSSSMTGNNMKGNQTNMKQQQLQYNSSPKVTAVSVVSSPVSSPAISRTNSVTSHSSNPFFPTAITSSQKSHGGGGGFTENTLLRSPSQQQHHPHHQSGEYQPPMAFFTLNIADSHKLPTELSFTSSTVIPPSSPSIPLKLPNSGGGGSNIPPNQRSVQMQPPACTALKNVQINLFKTVKSSDSLKTSETEKSVNTGCSSSSSSIKHLSSLKHHVDVSSTSKDRRGSTSSSSTSSKYSAPATTAVGAAVGGKYPTGKSVSIHLEMYKTETSSSQPSMFDSNRRARNAVSNHEGTQQKEMSSSSSLGKLLQQQINSMHKTGGGYQSQQQHPSQQSPENCVSLASSLVEEHHRGGEEVEQKISMISITSDHHNHLPSSFQAALLAEGRRVSSRVVTCSEKDPATIGGAIIDASSPEDSAKNCLGKLLENIDNLEGRATTLKRRVPSPYWGSPAARKGTPSSFISPFHTKAASTSGATITNKKEKPRTNGFHAPGQPFKDLRKNYS